MSFPNVHTTQNQQALVLQRIFSRNVLWLYFKTVYILMGEYILFKGSSYLKMCTGCWGGRWALLVHKGQALKLVCLALGVDSI